MSSGSLKIHGENGDSVHVYLASRQRGGGYVNDISVVAKGSGPEGGTILMLMGFSEAGVIGACRAATDPSLFDALASKYPNRSFSGPGNFTLVLSTEGIEDAIFNSDISAYVTNKPHSSLLDAIQKDSSRVR